MHLSSVVLYDLVAANIDQSAFQMYQSWKRAYGSSNRLLTPTWNDWFECSKVVRNLLRGQKSSMTGTVKKVTSAQQQQNDALIARTAWMHVCFVVTDNVRDFKKFEPYMKGLLIVPADVFFDN